MRLEHFWEQSLQDPSQESQGKSRKKFKEDSWESSLEKSLGLF